MWGSHPREACLRPLRGWGWWSRSLLCTSQARFVSLPPGEYVLTLRGGGGRMELFLRLSPGANVELLCDPAGGRCCWRRDTFRYFFNQL